MRIKCVVIKAFAADFGQLQKRLVSFCSRGTLMVHVIVRIRIRISFIARHVYAYEEFVLVIEAPQCDRMTVTKQDTDNKKNNIQIYKIDNVQNSQNTIYKIDHFVL